MTIQELIWHVQQMTPAPSRENVISAGSGWYRMSPDGKYRRIPDALPYHTGDRWLSEKTLARLQGQQNEPPDN